MKLQLTKEAVVSISIGSTGLVYLPIHFVVDFFYGK